MVKSLMVGVFGCLEYVIAFLFIASLALMLAQGLDKLVPWAYDRLAEENLADVLKQGCDTNQITRRQGDEIFLAYKDEQAGLQRLRTYILYAVSICISAVVLVLLFKKYRSLRFRERFRDYFFLAET